MINKLNNTQIALDNINGFHIYDLSNTANLTFANCLFCEMLGVLPTQALADGFYQNMIHPADKSIFNNFISDVSSKEQTVTAEYRIVNQQGKVIYVSDTTTSKFVDGKMLGYSVITDITTLKNENINLQFLNETIPFGFLKFTCEKQPKITYINDQMRKLLRFPQIQKGDFDHFEHYKNDMYLMIPVEERSRFSNFLERVSSQGIPMAGDMQILRCDGSKVAVFGWVIKTTNEFGQEEYQAVCIDITQKQMTKKATAMSQYLKALGDVYDIIYEFDFANGTMKCVHGFSKEEQQWMQNVPNTIEQATEYLIQYAVVNLDRKKLKKYFEDYYSQQLGGLNTPPQQIKFRTRYFNDQIINYQAVFIKFDVSISLFCCRRIVEGKEADPSRNGNLTFKNMNENMQELIMHFTDGIAAFQVKNDTVRPLYSSDNICEFFGFSKNEWLDLMQKDTSLKEFVSRCTVDYKEFVKLLDVGEAEFTYLDVKSQTKQVMKAICSQKSPNQTALRYVMLYNKQAQENSQKIKHTVYIRTFGYFDVFVDDKPIAFRNKKSKELLAMLVDRRGGYITSEEAIGYLWEDEPADSIILARYRKVALRLKNILEEYGIADIMESIDGKRRIVTEKVSCDLYDYLSGKEEFAQSFKGSYLTNYSWSETTLGELLTQKERARK